MNTKNGMKAAIHLTMNSKDTKSDTGSDCFGKMNKAYIYPNYLICIKCNKIIIPEGIIYSSNSTINMACGCGR